MAPFFWKMFTYIDDDNKADVFELYMLVADFPPVAHLSTICRIYGGQRGAVGQFFLPGFRFFSGSFVPPMLQVHRLICIFRTVHSVSK